MFNLVICELKKLKRKWFFMIIGVWIVIQMCFLPINGDVIKSSDEIFTWVNLMVFSCGFLVAINLLTANIILTEFKNGTIEVWATYRHGRWKMFCSKIVAIILISLFLYMIEFLMITAICLIESRDTLTLDILMKHFIITMKSFSFQMLMITVTASITLVCKNIMYPIMYIVVQLIASFGFLNFPPIRGYIPFALPVVPNLILLRDMNYHKIVANISIMPSAVIIALVMFVGGLIYGGMYINKMEIN